MESPSTYLRDLNTELRVRRLSILDAEILSAVETAKATQGEVEAWARVFYTTIYHGSVISLGNFYANAPDDTELRAQLAANLFEEETGLLSGVRKSHMELFSDFLLSLGLSAVQIQNLESPFGAIIPQGRPIEAQRYYLELCTFSILGEAPNAEFCGRMAQALQDKYRFDGSAIAWFSLHAELDKDHGSEILRYLNRVGVEGLEELKRLVLEMAPLLRLVWDGYSLWTGDAGLATKRTPDIA